jgi:hypothetical protein
MKPAEEAEPKNTESTPPAGWVRSEDGAWSPPLPGFRGGDRGYGEVGITDTPNGPKFDGPVPQRIGVDPELLAKLPPYVGEFRQPGGYLRLIDVEFRQVGWDGPIHVFERIDR